MKRGFLLISSSSPGFEQGSVPTSSGHPEGRQPWFDTIPVMTGANRWGNLGLLWNTIGTLTNHPQIPHDFHCPVHELTNLLCSSDQCELNSFPFKLENPDWKRANSKFSSSERQSLKSSHRMKSSAGMRLHVS